MLILKTRIINASNAGAETKAWFSENILQKRITKLIKENATKLNWKCVEFPMPVDNIGIFEKINPKYGLNVCGYKNEQVYSLRITNNKSREATINLLMIPITIVGLKVCLDY